jgi:uncharacterized protein YdaU (DUF1376 family)
VRTKREMRSFAAWARGTRDVAEFPALPLWTDAYLGDTTHLTTIEHGAYLLLLMTAWRTRDCTLPDDDRLLARYARCTAGQWKRLRPILEPFFVSENGQWRQSRLTDEAVAVRQHRELQSQKGKASALKRKGRHSTAVKSGSLSVETEPQPTSNSHLHSHKSSEDKSSGGKPPANDAVKELFDVGVSILVDAGSSEKEARSLIGKWKKSRGEVEVMKALLECRRQEIASPVEWLTKRLQQSRYVSPSGYEYRGSVDDVIRESEKRADWGTYWKAKADRDGREVPKAAGATQ